MPWLLFVLLFSLLGASSPAGQDPEADSCAARMVLMDELFRTDPEFREAMLKRSPIILNGPPIQLDYIVIASNFPPMSLQSAASLLRKYFAARKELPAIVPSEAVIRYLSQKHQSLFRDADADTLAKDLVSQVLTLADESKLAIRVYDNLRVDMVGDGKAVIYIDGSEERAEFDLYVWVASRQKKKGGG